MSNYGAVGEAAGPVGAPAGGMSGLEPGLGTAENYRRFARREAAGRSPAYESLALAIADDGVILGFLASLPVPKRQPNLLFAAARYLLDAVPEVTDLRRLVVDRHDRLVEVMLERRTQTNEPARCATILPALWRLPQPLALIEVGASAGLTLLVDRYSYDYDGTMVTGADPQAPTLSCHLEGPVPLPGGVPEVIWRQGIDLNPLDPASDDDVRWLECLIWPGEEGRVQRLHEAVAAARRHPVTVRRGDLLDDLATVVSEAPRDATVVVFHTAVLAYVDADKRAAFADALRGMGVTWLSNEAPGVLGWLPRVTESDGFALVQDGRTVLAETDPHGRWLRWR
ncbi:MAG: DUF2332 domain-containing protein [Actinomycetota bacterium]|nr:DUF2332 domain-containing protein [Actinomycetota bacterium]